jgi:hypothetical protein
MKYLTWVVVLLVSLLAIADGPAPAAGSGPVSDANGTGKVSFKQGDLARQLPLHKIEIKRHSPAWAMISLVFLDPMPDLKMRDRFELHFMFDGKTGKVRDSFISGLSASTKAGYSKISSGKSKCELIVANFTDAEIAGTLSCTGLTDMSAQQTAPALTDVKFEARTK